MDLFIYNATYQVWICTAHRCQYAVSPTTLICHLRDRHHSHPTAATVALCQAALTEMLKRPWIDPSQEAGLLPPPGAPPVEGLPVYQGYGCPHCPYVGRTARTLQDHRRRNHQEQDGHCGRGYQPVKLARARARNCLADCVVHCQCFFPSGPGSSFFTVCPAPGPGGPGTQGPRTPRGMAMTPSEFTRAQVDQLLGEGLQEASDQNIIVPENKHPTEVSPWLELTCWPEYLRGQELGAVAELRTLPNPARELLLEIHLRPSTYRQYHQVWQRLVCFTYHSTCPDQAIQLHHQLTIAQMAALDEMEVYGTQWLQLEETGATQMAKDEGAVRQEQAMAKQVLTRLDHACLALLIALLDHPLKGDLFESTLVGFLAILGVDMLVAEHAVRLAEEGQVTHPADALDEMREQFLLYGVRAPFSWITQLRTYGKKIQNTTTSLGYIYWSDDEQTLTYKDLQITMTGFCCFIWTQVALAQADLARLFLLHEEEVREEVVLSLTLHALQGDPINNQWVEPSCPRWACAPPDWSVALAPPSYPPRVLPVRACVGIQPPDMVLPMFPTSAL
ncbi:hypothetical protein GB937_010862 [Aspergillus fischeri]|nr:hypothetical protein GB937_010862 [Aspergillus fischeri]